MGAIWALAQIRKRCERPVFFKIRQGEGMMIILITLRASREETIFPESRDYLKFLQILVGAKDRHASALYAFCLMPDYCKIIAGFSHGAKTREFIRHIRGAYEDHLFIVSAKQDLLKNELPIALTDSYELIDAIKKVEDGPVNAGLVLCPTQYPYGSAYHRRCRFHALENVH
jgi:hypothetical protein